MTDKKRARRWLGSALREYKPGSDVLAEQTEHNAVSKTLSLGHGLSISTDVHREPALTGLGLVLVNDASPCFSWEWFDRDNGDVFRKLQGGAKVRVDVVDGTLAAVEFLDDAVLDCQDQSDGTVYEVQVRRGSVLRLRPRARGLLPEETSKRHSSDAIPVRITGSRFGNSATSDSRPPIACT